MLIILVFLAFTTLVFGQSNDHGSTKPDLSRYDLAKIIIEGTEPEKEKAWNTFLSGTSWGETDTTVYFQDLIYKAPEPYKNRAWSKMKESNLYGYDGPCSALPFIIIYTPEPYKSLAWQELLKCSVGAKENASLSILFSGNVVEPYALWAWQIFDYSLLNVTDPRSRQYRLAGVVRQSKEPYQKMAWEKLVSVVEKPDVLTLEQLVYYWPYPEPYVSGAWQIIASHNPKTVAGFKEYIETLKKIANLSPIRFQKEAIARLLDLKQYLSDDDANRTEELNKAFAIAEENDIKLGKLPQYSFAPLNESVTEIEIQEHKPPEEP